jgi:glycosyltransferase involved in cell wall biosynthesis
MKDAYLVLFLTEGTTLVDWHQRGLLSREAALYLRLREHLGGIAWVTYGGQSDLDFARELPGIDILVNRWRLPNAVYIQQMPWLHREAFTRATILKSEQTGASRAAVAVARHFGKRLIARSGFSLALFAQYDPDQYAESYDDILALEKISFEAAQQVVVTTEEMRQAAIDTHHLTPEKIRVIPNYVDTEHFSPSDRPSDEAPKIVFAGRLVEQKNVENLLEAVAPMTEIRVDFIGDGPLREKLANRIAAEGLHHVSLLGNQPNASLPDHFRAATVYAQPSRYEGHPKTIFEAMACGVPVLAGDAPGVRQFIEHGKTGWLVGLDAASIRTGLQALLNDEDLRAKIGAAGRAYVEKNLALNVVVGQEMAMLESVMQLSAPMAKPGRRPVLRSAWTYAARVARLIRKA